MIPDKSKIQSEMQRVIKDMSFIIKKTHKVAVAISIISRCLLESDPFRNSLRESSNSLLFYTSNFHRKSHLDKEIIFGKIEEILILVDNQITLLWTLGEINESTYFIIKNAISKLGSELKNNSVPYKGEESIFLNSGTSGRSLFDETWLQDKEAVTTTHKATQILRDIDSVALKNKPLETNLSEDKGHSTDERRERINKILSFIKDKGDVSVKDISGLIDNVGTKTIQRDIQYLIDKGQIKQTGQKRWARYVYLR